MLQNINLGTLPGDKTGTPARAAGQIINDNFAYLESKIDTQTFLEVENGFSLVGEDITMAADWSWIIKGMDYTNPSAVTFTIPLPAAGYERIDLIVCNTSNTFSRIAGVEVLSAPVAPSVPVNTVLATFFVVDNDSVKTPVIPRPKAPVTSVNGMFGDVVIPVHFKGVFVSLSALNTALPTASAGDYAQVNETGSTDVINYNWDAEENIWVLGGSGGSGASNTDALPEGTSNLYFTTARVLATLLTGISFVTGGAIVSTDSVIVAFGKIQKQIADALMAIGLKQDVLVSGTNIKTINGSSLLGSGDITISGGGGGASNLNDLLDVNVPSPEINNNLTFNGTEWVSAPNPTVSGVFSGGQFVLPEMVGNIYNKNTWANTTDFTPTGTASVSLNGDKLNLTSSGSGSFGDMLKINNKISLLERWNIKAKVKVTSNTTTSWGIGFGIRSVNTFGAPSLIGRFTTYPTGNVLVLNNGASNGEVRNVSTFNMAINDIIEFELDFSDGYIILSLKKGTTIITTTYQYNLYNLAPFLPNTGQFVATILGPSAEIQELNISSSIFKRADLMIIGDSKLQGYNTSGFQRTVCSLLRQRYPIVINSAGGYDRTAEGVARLTELKALIPKNVVLHLGSNDKRTGVTFSDWSTRFMQIKTEMESVGSVVYAMKMFNENTLVFTDYNDFITANFPANRIIDVGNLVNLIDGIHPNDQHQVQIMEAIYAKVGYVKSIYVESGVTNSSTTSLSKSYLDANYPNVSVGFKVYANSIVAGALEYEKTNLGWIQKSVNVLT